MSEPTPTVRIERLVAALGDVLNAKAGVRFGYLFGSQADGETTPLSDVDVAVYHDPSLTPAERRSLRLELIRDLSRALKRSDIDLVMLNDAVPEIAHRAAAGQLIMERDHDERVQFEVDAFKRFGDREPLRRIFRRALFERIEKGKFGG